MLYSIYKYIAYRKRNFKYIIANLKNGETYMIMFPTSVVWEGLEKNLDEEIICSKLKEMGIENSKQTFDLIIQELIRENLIYENHNKYCDKNNSFNIEDDLDNVNNQFINKVSIILTDKCNFKCVHCYNKEYYQQTKQSMQLEDWKKTIDDLKRLGCLYVMVTGGEPFIYPNIFEILDYLEKNKFSFDIITNGSLIDDMCIEKLKDYNMLNSISITLYGLRRSTYEDVTTKSLDPSMIIDNYHKMKKYDINVRLQYCYLENNYFDARRINIYESQNNVKISKVYTPIFSALSGINNEKLNLKFNQLKFLYKEKCLEFNINNNPINKCGRERCSINFNGDVAICEKFQDLKIGNLFTNDLTEIWNSKQLQSFIYSCDLCIECKECNKKQYCLRCNGLAYIETKSPNTKIPYLCKLTDEICEILRENEKICSR